MPPNETLARVPYPLFRPLVVMKAYRGPINEPIYCETYLDAIATFGKESFDRLNTTYFSDEALYLLKMFEEGGSAFIVRLADDTAEAAILIYELEVYEDADVPQYEVGLDGMRTVDGSGDWIPDTPATAPGTKLTWHIRNAVIGLEEYDNLVARVDADPITGDPTTIYPMLSIKTSNPGVWGDNLATSFYYDGQTSNVDLVNRIGAALFTMAPVLKERNNSTNTPIRDINNNTSVSFCIKPNVVDPNTNLELSIAEVFAARYEDVQFDINVYTDNWEAIGDIVLTYEDTTNLELADAWHVNSISAKYADGRYYANVWLVTADEVGETTPVARMIPDNYHFCDNGVDGELTWAAVELMMSSFYTLGINTNIVDASRYPFNTIIDTGHSIAVKYDMIDFLAIRDDVFLILATQNVSEEPYTKAAELSVASTLRSRCLSVPESIVTGLGCCRAMICVGSAVPLQAGTWYAPTTLDIAMKFAKHYSNQYLDQEFAGRPNSEVRSFHVTTFNWIPAAGSVKSNIWNTGLNYVQYYNVGQIHWPALRTVNVEETSALVSVDFVFAVICMKQMARELYTNYSNVTMSFEKLSSLLHNSIVHEAHNIIRNRYVFDVHVFRTQEEELLGFITHAELELIAPTTNRVTKFDIHTSHVASDVTTLADDSPVAYATEPISEYPSEAFTTTWNIPSDGFELILPFTAAGAYDVEIHWGDGTVTSGDDGSDPSWYTHTYENAGTYSVYVTGTADRLSFVGGTADMRNALLSVDEFLDLGWTDLNHAFYQCTNLADVANIDVGNVTNIESMFEGAISANPDISSWDASNITNAQNAFNGCVAMTGVVPTTSLWKNINTITFANCFTGAVNISNYSDIPGTWKGGDKLTFTFNTSGPNVTVILPFVAGGEYCSFINWGDGSDTSGDDGSVGVWYTHEFAASGVHTVTVDGYATHCSYLDANATSREALTGVPDFGDLGWTSWENAFYECTNLTSVILGEIPNLTNMRGLFYNATSINQDVSGWDVSNITDMNSLFRGAVSVSPDVSNWDVSNVTTMSGMFYGCTAANPDVSNWDVVNVTSMSNMFNGASIATPVTTNWDVGNVTTMASMFSEASLANPNVLNWDTAKTTSLAWMFYKASAANPDVSNWDVSNVTSFSGMFCNAYTGPMNPDVSNWDVSSGIDVSYMFQGSYNANPDTSLWVLSSATNCFQMFSGCTGMTNAVPAAQFWDRVSPVWTNYTSCFYLATGISNYGSIPSNWKSSG